MAKSGTLAADLAAGTDDLLAAEIVSVEAPKGTVGAVVAQAIEAARSNVDKAVMVDGLGSEIRKISVSDAASLNLVGANLITLRRTLVGNEAEVRKSAPWGVTNPSQEPDQVAIATALIDLLAPTPPRLTLASILNKIEDTLIALGLAENYNVAVDQSAYGGQGTVTIAPEGDVSIAPAQVVIVQTVAGEDAAALPPRAFE